MGAAFWCNVVGLVFGLIGSILLAFSLNRVIQELVLTIQFHDLTIGQLVGHGDIPVFEGIEKRLQTGVVSAIRRTVAGIALLAIGFGLQLLALFLSLPAPAAGNG